MISAEMSPSCPPPICSDSHLLPHCVITLFSYLRISLGFTCLPSIPLPEFKFYKGTGLLCLVLRSLEPWPRTGLPETKFLMIICWLKE